MRSPLTALEGRRYDLAVIGGGINGAGIAQQAAARGWRVLLAEQDDFGSGTTWRSTKLIHGGLRYLEHGELRLVFESLRERRALLRLAPRQVRPLAFLLPVYRGYRHRALTIWLGLMLYDLLSLRGRLPKPRRLSAASLLGLAPALAAEGLQGGFLYYDAQALSPERLCLEYILAARAAGAEVRNHCEVVEVNVEDGRAHGLRLRDRLDGSEATIQARAIINAAGPWVDQVLARSGRTLPRQIGGTRGSHLMVDYGGRGPRHAIYSEAGHDGRPFFIVPWREWHLIGTTDLRFEGDPTAILPADAEIDYLLAEANRRLPRLPLSMKDILYAYAGVRPLPYTAAGAEGSITRRHIIRDHAPDGLAGLYSILGGKLSTFRSLAAEAIKQVADHEHLPRQASRGQAQRQGQRICPLPASPALPAPVRQHLVALYGGRAAGILRLIADDPELGRPICPHGPTLAAEVVYAAQEELALTAGDVLLRRTGAGWNACAGLDGVETVARLLLDSGAISRATPADLVAAYRAEVAATMRFPGAPVVGALAGGWPGAVAQPSPR